MFKRYLFILFAGAAFWPLGALAAPTAVLSACEQALLRGLETSDVAMPRSVLNVVEWQAYLNKLHAPLPDAADLLRQFTPKVQSLVVAEAGRAEGYSGFQAALAGPESCGDFREPWIFAPLARPDSLTDALASPAARAQALEQIYQAGLLCTFKPTLEVRRPEDAILMLEALLQPYFYANPVLNAVRARLIPERPVLRARLTQGLAELLSLPPYHAFAEFLRAHDLPGPADGTWSVDSSRLADPAVFVPLVHFAEALDFPWRGLIGKQIHLMLSRDYALVAKRMNPGQLAYRPFTGVEWLGDEGLPPTVLSLATHIAGVQGTLVDVAAGAGEASLLLATLFPATQVLGFELVPEKVFLANRFARELGLRNATFRAQDLAARDFNLPAADVYYVDRPGNQALQSKLWREMLAATAAQSETQFVFRGMEPPREILKSGRRCEINRQPLFIHVRCLAPIAK